jgi:methionyl-tRNA formyltransferase
MDNAMEQDEELVVNADMIDSSEGELRVWEENARVCHNKVRGFSMWPGTFLYFLIGDDDGIEPMKVKVIQSRVLQDDAGSVDLTEDVVPGPEKKDGLRLVCGDGSVLELLQIQPVTRKAMDAKSFVNGLRGERLRWVKSPNEFV